MLPYDKFRSCEMCGQSGASSQYKTLMLNGVAIPVIVRYCPNCSFTWNELATEQLNITLNVNGVEYLPPAEWLSEFVQQIGAYSERDVTVQLKASGFRVVGPAVAQKVEVVERGD